MPKPRQPKTDPPDAFTHEQRQELWRWAKPQRYSKRECLYAIEFVLDWARGGEHQKKDWVATVRNAMRAGWALPPSGQTRHYGAQPGSFELPQEQGPRGNNVTHIADVLERKK